MAVSERTLFARMLLLTVMGWMGSLNQVTLGRLPTTIRVCY